MTCFEVYSVHNSTFRWRMISIHSLIENKDFISDQKYSQNVLISFHYQHSKEKNLINSASLHASTSQAFIHAPTTFFFFTPNRRLYNIAKPRYCWPYVNNIEISPMTGFRSPETRRYISEPYGEIHYNDSWPLPKKRDRSHSKVWCSCCGTTANGPMDRARRRSPSTQRFGSITRWRNVAFGHIEIYFMRGAAASV